MKWRYFFPVVMNKFRNSNCQQGGSCLPLAPPISRQFIQANRVHFFAKLHIRGFPNIIFWWVIHWKPIRYFVGAQISRLLWCRRNTWLIKNSRWRSTGQRKTCGFRIAQFNLLAQNKKKFCHFACICLSSTCQIILVQKLALRKDYKVIFFYRCICIDFKGDKWKRVKDVWLELLWCITEQMHTFICT